jgi:hypothetical protein
LSEVTRKREIDLELVRARDAVSSHKDAATGGSRMTNPWTAHPPRPASVPASAPAAPPAAPIDTIAEAADRIASLLCFMAIILFVMLVTMWVRPARAADDNLTTWYVVNQETDHCVMADSLFGQYPTSPLTPEAMARTLRARGARVEEEIYRDPPPDGKHIKGIAQTIYQNGVEVGGVMWFDSMDYCERIRCWAKCSEPRSSALRREIMARFGPD